MEENIIKIYGELLNRTKTKKRWKQDQDLVGERLNPTKVRLFIDLFICVVLLIFKIQIQFHIYPFFLLALVFLLSSVTPTKKSQLACDSEVI